MVVERVFWTAAGWLCTRRRIDGLRFIFVSARGERLVQELAPVLEQALERVAVAGDSYRRVVKDNLRFVAAANVSNDYVSVPAQGYVSAFRHSEAISPHYLASNLVWAAEFIRVGRSTRAESPSNNRLAAYAAAKNSQLRFVREFPDFEQWVEYIEGHAPLE
jgi:carbohydrate-binding DOMON domain-containing protein